MEEPEWSNDRDRAWEYVALTELALRQLHADRHKWAQQDRARKPRPKRLVDGLVLEQLIRDLATAPRNQGLTAKELWPIFYSWLDEEGLKPCEHSPPDTSSKSTIAWSGDADRPGKISFGHFANLVSQARRPKKSE